MDIRKNEIYELNITDLGNNGEGIGKIDGYTLFVEGALPGEKVRVLAVKVNKNFGYGKLIEIIEPSSDRIVPACPSADKCGGCSLQHLRYSAQLEYKRNKVEQCIKRIGGFTNATALPTISMDEPINYRNKAQYPVSENDGLIKLGFYSRRSHRIVECNTCLIGSKTDPTILKAIKEFLESNNISVYDEITGKGLIRHILIRTGFYTNEIMVCLVVNSATFKYKNAFVNALKDIDNITSIVINHNTSRSNVILGTKCTTIYGNDYITDCIGSLKFRISPLSFFQVNPIQTYKLYSKALEYADLKGDEIVVDAYCGIGTISLFLAQKAKYVYGIEIVPPAIDNANENKKLNNIENVSFYVGKSEEILPKLYADGIRPDVIVVDPPRKGCDKSLLDMMLTISPERIVYVSCDPATLARDLKILCKKNYQLNYVQPVDMFPHTTHVETVVLMSRIYSDCDTK